MSPTTDASTEMTRLSLKLNDAKAALAAVDEQNQAASTRVREIEEELAALIAAKPETFDAAGNPKPKSAAAKLVDEKQALLSPAVPWSRRREDAALAVRDARNALGQFKEAHVVDLAKALEPRARAAVAGVDEAIDTLLAAIAEVSAVDQEFVELLSSARGLSPKDEMPRTEMLGQLARELRRHRGSIPAPLPRSLFPGEGRVALRKQTEGGGWINVADKAPVMA